MLIDNYLKNKWKQMFHAKRFWKLWVKENKIGFFTKKYAESFIC